MHRCLTQRCILDDLALHTGSLATYRLAQALQLGNQPVDLLDRGASHPLQQRGDIVGDEVAVVSSWIAPPAGDVPAHEFANLPFNLANLSTSVVSRLKILMFDFPRYRVSQTGRSARAP